MLPGRSAHRREARELEAHLGQFEARLDSSHQGIAFHVLFTATVRSEPPYPMPVKEAAAEIRIALRHAAADFLQQHSAVDLASVQELLARELGRRRELASEPPIAFHATADLDLLPGDQAAVEALLTAQREQTIADARRLQTTEALAMELSDPVGVLARSIARGDTDWSKTAQDRAVEIAEVFSRYRRPGRQGVEHTLVEVVREFLSSFADPAQKQMLYGLLAAGMRAAERPLHAGKVGALLDTPLAESEAPDRET